MVMHETLTSLKKRGLNKNISVGQTFLERREQRSDELGTKLKLHTFRMVKYGTEIG